MNKFLRFLIFFGLFIDLATGQEKSVWLKVPIGTIGIASESILEASLRQAKEQDLTGLILTVNSSGGSLESVRNMVTLILNSDLPILVWVGPSGAHAASAGSFIALASHVAAMAPMTNIGAATPITSSGADIEKDLKAKVEQDTLAFLESICKARGRNFELAKAFVITASSVTAEEALDQKIIDLISASEIDLLKDIDGRTIKLSDKKSVTLKTKNAKIDEYQKSLQQIFLEIISNPNLFYLFLLAGLIGIGFELTHPGGLFPGIAGGISLVLALIAMSILPINFGALILLLIGIGCMIAEMFLPSFGILGIGGIVAFGTGSFLLVDPGNEQGLRISLSVIIPSSLFLLGVIISICYLVIQSTRNRISSGIEGMMNRIAEVTLDFNAGKGRVRLDGEDWGAVSNEQINKGDQVKVVAVNGLTLTVQKI